MRVLQPLALTCLSACACEAFVSPGSFSATALRAAPMRGNVKHSSALHMVATESKVAQTSQMEELRFLTAEVTFLQLLKTWTSLGLAIAAALLHMSQLVLLEQL
jgi:hypothetical protein